MFDQRVRFQNAVSGRKVGTVGDPVQVTATSTPCGMVHIQAFPGNSGNVAIGDEDINAASGSERGKILAPGEHYDYPIDNLSKVYLDILTTGDGISYLYFS